MHPLLRRLDLNLLLVFDALYRHRNVGTAASELAISASAFSHALGRLRQGLDDKLFLRQGNRMQPTQRAEHLAAAVAAALRALGEGWKSGGRSYRDRASAPSSSPPPTTPLSPCFRR